jgi:hypothetical protein
MLFVSLRGFLDYAGPTSDFRDLPTQGRKTLEMPARKPAWQAWRPTPRGTGVAAPVFHEIPQAAGPLEQTTKNDRLRHQSRGTVLSSYFLDTALD